MKHCCATTLGFMLCFIWIGNASCAWAQDWESNTGMQTSFTTFSGSDTRKNIKSLGIFSSSEYLDTGGFSLGLNTLNLDYVSYDSVRQNSAYVSGRYYLYNDALGGKITLRLDAHQNNLDDGNTYNESVTTIAPQLSFLNYQKTWYADLGAAYSQYKSGLNVSQLTPTLGFAFNDAYDWLQLRGYLISSNDISLSQGMDKTKAAEIKWWHWFDGGSWIENIQISSLLGQRMLAVDVDAASVYTLADLQQGSASFAVQGPAVNNSKILLAAGYEKFLNQTTQDDYKSIYVYLNWSAAW